MLHLILRSCVFFPSHFPTNVLYVFHVSMHVACTAHLILYGEGKYFQWSMINIFQHMFSDIWAEIVFKLSLEYVVFTVVILLCVA